MTDTLQPGIITILSRYAAIGRRQEPVFSVKRPIRIGVRRSRVVQQIAGSVISVRPRLTRRNCQAISRSIDAIVRLVDRSSSRSLIDCPIAVPVIIKDLGEIGISRIIARDVFFPGFLDLCDTTDRIIRVGIPEDCPIGDRGIQRNEMLRPVEIAVIVCPGVSKSVSYYSISESPLDSTRRSRCRNSLIFRPAK